MADRLSSATLGRLPAAVGRPGYDRGAVATGIVHLGIGAFHRAHMAAYTDAVLAEGDPRWGILGASLRSPDTHDALAPQDGLYALAVRDAAGERLAVVGSVTRLLVAPQDPGALLDAMSAPETRIVSLTVTEKGYCHAPATGELDERHPDVVHDLAHPDTPRSAPGFIVEALRRRRAAGLPFFTALCCDNLPHNGATLRRVLVRFATLRDPALGERRGAGPALPLHHGGPDRAGHDRCGPGPYRGGARPRRRLAHRHRTLHPMGDRGRFRDRPPGVGPGRRHLRQRRRALRTRQAAHAERQPFDAGLSRLSRGPRDRGRRHGGPGLRRPGARA